MAGYDIARVGTSHAAVVAALHQATIGGGWSAGSVERLLALPGAFALLATRRVGTAPDGFALALPSGDDVELVAIGVVPGARRRGCGRALMHDLLSHAAASGAVKCLLEVAEDNGDALGLYTACGFRQYGKRPGYYHRPNGMSADALLLMHQIGDVVPIS